MASERYVQGYSNAYPSPASVQSVSSPQQQTTGVIDPFKGRGRGTTLKPRGRPPGSKNKPKRPDHGLPKEPKKKGRPPGSKNKHSKWDHNLCVTRPDGSLGSQSQQTPILPVAATNIVTPQQTPTMPQPAYGFPIGYAPATGLDSPYPTSAPGADFMRPAPTGYLPPTTSPYTDVGHHQHPDLGGAPQYPAPRQTGYVYGNSNIFLPSEPNHSFRDGTFTPADNDSSNSLRPLAPPQHMSPYAWNGGPEAVTTEHEHHDVSAQTTAPTRPEYDGSNSLDSADEYLKAELLSFNNAPEPSSLNIDPNLSEVGDQNTLSAPTDTTGNGNEHSSGNKKFDWDDFEKRHEKQADGRTMLR